MFCTFELDVLMFKFHGFVTGLVFEPHTILSAYYKNTKEIHM